MKKLKVFFTVVTLLLTGVSALAQTMLVKGTVVDASTGEPVPYAAIQVQGTSTGTTTDVNGTYTISVSPKATLVFSSIGYISKDVPVAGRAQVDCALAVDANMLEDVVVVGYGSSKKVGNLVGSVQTVKADVIKNAPSSSALDQLQGQVAGMTVLTSNGVAGDNAVSIKLHGRGSIGTSSSPLYVIDGIPSSSRSVMAMNPNDIETISVLKDASATSIYGSRAANGVIYITTKGGSYNEKASVTLRSQYGVSTLASLNLYENMMDSNELVDFWIRSGIHSEEFIKTTYYDKGYNANTKWYNYLMNLNTPQYQNDITIEGGGSKVAYMIAASQFHQEGFTPGNYYDRYTVRSNVQGHPTKWLKFGVNANVSMDYTWRNGNWGNMVDGMAAYFYGGVCYLLNPLYPAIDPETGKEYEKKYPNNMTNPDYYLSGFDTRYERYGFNGNAYVEIEPVKNLRLVSRAGVDGYFGYNHSVRYPSYVAENGGTANASKSFGLNYSATVTNTAEYTLNIGNDHRFSVLAGQEGVMNDFLSFSASSTGHTDDRNLLLQQGKKDSFSVSESLSQSKFLSFFGHADYSFRDKYIIDGTVRNDSSSRFGADMRNATFWSAGAKWNIKKESFLRDVNWINNLSLKASYGTQGNAEIGNYSSLGLISATGSYHDVVSRFVSSPANSKLTWENQSLATIVLGGRLFNCFDFEFEVYNRQTTSMLMDVPQPYTTGFTEVTQNVGGFRNRGIDITLGVDIIQTRDAYLRVSTTFNYNSQAVTELFDGRKRWEVANTMTAYVVGKPVMFYLPIYAGVDPEDGAPMWYLPGEDKDVLTMDPAKTTKVFDEDALTQNSGKSVTGPINGGFSIAGGWKGFSIQANFGYAINKYLVSNDGIFYANPATNSNYNQIKEVSDFWTPDHRDAKYPDWSKGYQMQFDTHLLENASFLRLKNLQIGYDLPKKALAWSKGVLNGVKITFTGRNILTFTGYTGIDPEVDSNLTYGMPGNSKQFLGGLEIKF